MANQTITQPRPQPQPQPAAAMTDVEQVAVVAAGTIGVSWTALFLAHGLTVRVYDPRPGIGEFVHTTLAEIAPTLTALGLPTDHLDDRLSVVSTAGEAVAGAQLVQENGPENLAVKHSMLADIEAAAAPDALILSSTSALPASELAAGMTHPERLLVAHPFNPPHLVPLVELARGKLTSEQNVARALAFYRAVGKHPIVLASEVPGFVANRLQAALFRECIHLVMEGVVDLAQLDDVVTSSIGLRWAAQGPFLSFDLGGGDGGLQAFFEHLGPDLESIWKTLGTPTLDQDAVSRLASQADRFYGTDRSALSAERDRAQVAILNALAAVHANEA